MLRPRLRGCLCQTRAIHRLMKPWVGVGAHPGSQWRTESKGREIFVPKREPAAPGYKLSSWNAFLGLGWSCEGPSGLQDPWVSEAPLQLAVFQPPVCPGPPWGRYC